MHDVLEKFFNPHDFRLAMPDVWAGFQVNIKLMVVAEALVLVLALALAVVRGLPGRGAVPVAWPSAAVTTAVSVTLEPKFALAGAVKTVVVTAPITVSVPLTVVTL